MEGRERKGMGNKAERRERMEHGWRQSFIKECKAGRKGKGKENKAERGKERTGR